LKKKRYLHVFEGGGKRNVTAARSRRKKKETSARERAGRKKEKQFSNRRQVANPTSNREAGSKHKKNVLPRRGTVGKRRVDQKKTMDLGIRWEEKALVQRSRFLFSETDFDAMKQTWLQT